MMRPQTAQELRVLLIGIFPGFAEACPEEDAQLDATLHSVMRAFTPYFSGNREALSQRQIKSLAHFINEAVAVDDKLENAVGTCFLEHLRQVSSYKVLASFLSRKAKDKTHA